MAQPCIDFHAPLDRHDVEQLLAAQAAFPLLRGIRHKPRAAPYPNTMQIGAPGSISDPRWQVGFALLERYGLSFDHQMPVGHLMDQQKLYRDNAVRIYRL
ncbi:MAG TPA: hypothetical protein VFU22_20765 [Roseiflexaceae bacterium]|nr:hypothetical protein [Roseiflexaceae bacterium]